MATQFGQDSTCLTDVALIDTQITNPQILIGQRIARRLQTPRGALANIGDDPNFGYDLRQLVNARLSPATRSQFETQIGAECEKDECVQSATVTIADNGSGEISVSISLQSAAGPFSLVVSVDQLTTAAVFNFSPS